VGLERDPLSLVSTIEELLERKSSGCGLESREYGRRNPSRWSRGTLYPQKVGTNFADRRRSFGRYSSLADSGLGVLYIWMYVYMHKSRGSAVSIAIGYALDDRRVGVPVPVGSRILTSPYHPDQLCGPPNLPSNWLRGGGFSFPGGKAAGAWSWPLTSN
jgi:hypothetical protein